MLDIYVPHAPLDYAAQEAVSLGLQLPKILVAERLATRLARHYRELVFDDIQLFNGINAAEVESPITVWIDSLPKGTNDTEPTLGFEGDVYAGNAKAILKISSSPEISEKAYGNLNTKFWLSMLVGEQIAEGLHQHNREPSSVKKRLGALGASLAVQGAGVTSLELTNSIELFANAGYLGSTFVLGAIASAIYTNSYNSKIRKPMSVDKIAKKYAKPAKELGKEYPVLSFIAR